jgi:hypothetical protein
MDIRDAFYHGIHQQIRRVITLLGPERTDKGLSAFEDGASNWSQCFFARALAPETLSNEEDVARILGLYQHNGAGSKGQRRYNVVPVRIVYQTFDGLSTMMTKEMLYKFISDIRDESRPSEVMNLLKSINYDEKKIADFSEVSCA